MNFDSLRFWLAREMNVKRENNEIDFFGSENNIVQTLVNVGLSSRNMNAHLNVQIVQSCLP